MIKKIALNTVKSSLKAKSTKYSKAHITTADSTQKVLTTEEAIKLFL